MCPKKIVRVEM